MFMGDTMFRIIIRIQFILLLCACSAHKEDFSEKPSARYQFTGTIVHQEIEGGFYGIQGDDGEKYDPVNLPPDLKVNGLRVRVLADPLPAGNSIHMWGKLIKIIDIQPQFIPDND